MRFRHGRSSMPDESEDEALPGMGSMMTPLLLLVLMSVLIINPSIRSSLAGGADSILRPLLPFSDQWFVLTVALVGSSIMIVNTVFRSFFMDPFKQAHLAHRNKQIRKLMNEARIDRDKARIDKIQKLQQRLMPEQMKLQNAMMKPMMFTMFFIIAIFAWIGTMVADFRVDYVSLPWVPEWNLLHDTFIFFPAWIAAYICMSAPLGRVVDRHIKLFRYRSHPLVVAGDKLEEPLLVILKEKKAKKQNNRRTQRSQRRNRGASEVIEDGKEIENKPAKGVNFTRVLPGISCRSCGGEDVIRTDSGRNRCQVCLDEWRR